MHERLLENWLDSASERSYQDAFCQMLAAEGHRILHSTRHGPLELGKDITSLDPTGDPCAFQLKGHPGGRLTLRGFREIEGQIRELLDYAIQHGDAPRRQHKSYLVTNGLIEEEVRHAVEQLNQANADAGYPARRLELLDRGALLERARKLGHSLWPSEIEQIHLLLQMLVEDGTAAFPEARFASMLGPLLGIDAPRLNFSAAELRRRIASSALLTSLSLQRFEMRDNHFAGTAAWTQYAVAVIGACDRYGLSFRKNGEAATTLALRAARDHLVDLAREVLAREYLVEGDPLTDAPVYKARHTLLLGLMSLLWFWCDIEGWPEDMDQQGLEAFLRAGRDGLYLWGEAAVPQFLLYYLWARRVETGAQPDALLYQMVDATCTDVTEPAAALQPPYVGIEDIVRTQLGESVSAVSQNPGRATFFGYPLLQLLVRTNWKHACKSLWPKVSKRHFAEFRPERQWQYCLPRSDRGTLYEVQPPHTKSWSDLVHEAADVGCPDVPIALSNRPMLHSLFVLLFPNRATPSVIRSLSHQLNRIWLIGEPPRP